MKDQFATYEISKKIKELGFDEPCLRGYDKNEMLFYSEQENGHYLNYSIGMNINAPLWQQVFDWLRKERKLQIIIIYCGDTYPTVEKDYDAYFYEINNGNFSGDIVDTYEEAREQAILKAIKMIKL